jgi:RecA-family ATPase
MLIGRGVLPVAGKVVLGGPPKSNKSFVGLNIGIALAKGLPIFGAMGADGKPLLPVYKKCKVLYLEQEIGDDGARNRLNGIVGGELDPDIPFFIKSRDMQMRLDTEEGRKLIDAEVAEVRPDVVIFDPLAKFHLLDENSAQHMGAIMRAGDKLIEKYGTALMYIHHTGKENADPDMARRGGNRLRGSSAVFADVDTLILIDRQGASTTKEPTIKLEFEVRQDEPLDNIFVRRLKSGICQYLPPFKREKPVEPSFVPEPFGGL